MARKARITVPVVAGAAILPVFLITYNSAAHAADLLSRTQRPTFCQLFDRHTPDADVAYQPGVDVHGKPVAGADLPSASAYHVPDSFSFPLQVDVAERLGLDQSVPGLEGKLELGEVKVEKDRVLLNGDTVPSLSRADVVALCFTKPGIR